MSKAEKIWLASMLGGTCVGNLAPAWRQGELKERQKNRIDLISSSSFLTPAETSAPPHSNCKWHPCTQSGSVAVGCNSLPAFLRLLFTTFFTSFLSKLD